MRSLRFVSAAMLLVSLTGCALTAEPRYYKEAGAGMDVTTSDGGGIVSDRVIPPANDVADLDEGVIVNDVVARGDGDPSPLDAGVVTPVPDVTASSDATSFEDNFVPRPDAMPDARPDARADAAPDARADAAPDARPDTGISPQDSSMSDSAAGSCSGCSSSQVCSGVMCLECAPGTFRCSARIGCCGSTPACTGPVNCPMM